jgi:hypothetical protein
LEGDEVDLEDWRLSLGEPFDPSAFKLSSGETVLRSADFDGLTEAEEVRERALVLIGRLNGALKLWNDARPVRFAGVYQIDGQGKQHTYIFAEMAAFELGRCVMRATATVLGPDGQPIPPPPPRPSQPQSWNQLAQLNDDVSDLLDHFGRADNWYDIYKTIEFAEHLVGSEQRLWATLDADGKAGKRLKASANYYRHAKAYRPHNLLSLGEGKSILAVMIRKVLSALV